MVGRSDAAAGENDVIVRRVIDAPRSLVFEAWTTPEHIVHWWRPSGFAPPVVVKMEPRVGGEFRMLMRHDDGKEYTAYGVYREIVKGERIVYDDFCDVGGTCFHEARVTVTMDEHAGRTTVTLRARLKPVPGRDPMWTEEIMRQGWQRGWNDNIDLLVPYLKKWKERR